MRTSTWMFCFKLLSIFIRVEANVEKTVFLTPSLKSSAGQYPNVGNFNLDTLTPQKRSIRRQIPAIFANTTNPQGTEIWFYLKGLEEQKRYEVRICWAATQPTSFVLKTYDLEKVFSTHTLLQSLTKHSNSIQPASGNPETRSINFISLSDILDASEPARVTLLLRISAAADYYSTNPSLMRSVPLVKTDIILDPFIFNILPSSLLPVAFYLTAIGIAAWFISDLIWLSLHHLALSINARSNSPGRQVPIALAKKDI